MLQDFVMQFSKHNIITLRNKGEKLKKNTIIFRFYLGYNRTIIGVVLFIHAIVIVSWFYINLGERTLFLSPWISFIFHSDPN